MNTRSIPLSQGKVAIVDDCDFEWLSKWVWCAQLQSDGITYYAVRSDDRYHLYMHRAILGLNKGDGRYADHVNLDTLDNRRVNLRVASPKDSAFNRGMRSDNTSGLKGVSRHKGGRWQAKIQVNKQHIWLGLHDSASDAHNAYRAAVAKHHGVFGRTE